MAMTDPKISLPAQDTLRFRDELINIRLSADDGNDGISVIEHRARQGEAAPLHIHRREDEIFHVLRGRLRFEVDGKGFVAGAGDMALAPKGVPHRFIVESEEG